MSLTVFEKRKISLQYFLQGRKYYNALKAMDFASQYHNKFRKDGITPEFDHQISIAQYIRTLPELEYPEETFIVTMLHDIKEDYDIENSLIVNMFGQLVATSVERTTKKFKGSVKPKAIYFDELSNDVIASIVKGIDRSHNYSTMRGVFKQEKQLSYLDEGVECVLPMLKKARKRFPSQESAYENIKHILKTQIDLLYQLNKQEERV